MRPFDALIFDLGNTLIYFDAEWPEVLAEANQALYNALVEAGLKIDRQFLSDFRSRLEAYFQERDTEFIEYTTTYILQEVLKGYGYHGITAESLRPALDAMYAVSQRHWQVEPDAVPTLKQLRTSGYRLGLISNAADDQDVQTLVDKSRIRPYFDQILTSAAHGIRKPNPRIFRTMLDIWGIAPQRAAMVGDTLGADILGAHNAGMYSIWITRRADRQANRDHSDTIQPNAIISTLSELPEILQKIPA